MTPKSRIIKILAEASFLLFLISCTSKWLAARYQSDLSPGTIPMRLAMKEFAVDPGAISGTALKKGKALKEPLDYSVGRSFFKDFTTNDVFEKVEWGTDSEADMVFDGRITQFESTSGWNTATLEVRLQYSLICKATQKTELTEEKYGSDVIEVSGYDVFSKMQEGYSKILKSIAEEIKKKIVRQQNAILRACPKAGVVASGETPSFPPIAYPPTVGAIPPVPVEERTVLMVADLNLVGLAGQLQLPLSNRLRAALQKTGLFRLTDPEVTRKAMQEQARQVKMADCYAEECLAEVGKALGARQMVTGAVTGVSREICTVDLKLFDIKTFTVINTLSESSPCGVEQLLEIISILGQNLVVGLPH